MIGDANLGDLDFFILDTPPGTSVIHLTLVQTLPITGAVIVSTPQKVALADARKGINMYQNEKVNVPILGLVENMAWFTPAELPQNKYYLFGKEGVKRLAEEMHVPLLGQIPIVQSICENGDNSTPEVLFVWCLLCFVRREPDGTGGHGLCPPCGGRDWPPECGTGSDKNRGSQEVIGYIIMYEPFCHGQDGFFNTIRKMAQDRREPSAVHVVGNMDWDGLHRPQIYYAMVAIFSGLFLSGIVCTICNVALPTIARQLQISSSDSIWIVNAFQLVVVMTLLPCSALGELFGFKRTYLWGMVFLTVFFL